MAITATAATKIVPGMKNMQMELHIVEFNSTDVTVEVSTDLVEIYAFSTGVAFGTDAGHTDGDLGILEIDETFDETNNKITVVSGAITVNRLLTDLTVGTVADQRCCLVLWGQG